SSTVVGTILPVSRRPSTKGPSNATPNQLPNLAESLIACHTRSRGARSRMFFSIRSVFMRNLLVAYLYNGNSHNATGWLHNRLQITLDHLNKVRLRRVVFYTCFGGV